LKDPAAMIMGIRADICGRKPIDLTGFTDGKSAGNPARSGKFRSEKVASRTGQNCEHVYH
jgi:hypothetical protein